MELETVCGGHLAADQLFTARLGDTPAETVLDEAGCLALLAREGHASKTGARWVPRFVIPESVPSILTPLADQWIAPLYISTALTRSFGEHAHQLAHDQFAVELLADVGVAGLVGLQAELE